MTEHQAAWSALHDGIAPSPVVLRWLALVEGLARPLVRGGLPAWSVTAAGVGLSVAAVVTPPRVAALLVGLAGVADGVDGAVAVLSGTASSAGARLDRAADRVSEALWVGALRPGRGLALAALSSVAAVEGFRVLLDRPPVATVAEKPNRVIVVGLALATGRRSAGAWTLVGLSGVGLAQLFAARRGSSRSAVSTSGKAVAAAPIAA